MRALKQWTRTLGLTFKLLVTGRILSATQPKDELQIARQMFSRAQFGGPHPW